jgi:hypothetical protein
LDTVELLIGRVLVHRPFGARVIAVYPGVKVIGSEKHFFAVADL